MNTEEQFIAEIISDPYSDDARLVYADWLEEQQDERAEYIRTEIKFANLDPFSKEAAKEFKRLNRMIARLKTDWQWRKETGVKYDYYKTGPNRKFRSPKVLAPPIVKSISLTQLARYPNQFQPKSEYLIRKHQPDSAH